ncbi:MAG TPA: pyridoxal phosphate-dependent aminotransferase [Chloroflexia bacterium]|nr:pyridoxal phosphate-dependent aminotransferase [Chloroflexia bacterium]
MTGFFAEGDLSPNMLEQARQRLTGYIDLTSSNPTRQGLLFPPQILAEAAGSYWSERRYQPDPLGALPARQAIARYYAQRTPALDLELNRLFITASTSEAYSLLFALLTEPGDNVLGPEVSYPLFEYLAAIHHIELRPYKMVEERGWQIDQESLLQQADERTRAVLLISPHNPTGMIVRERQEALSQLGLPVICDEVFAEFTFGVPHTPPFGAVQPDLTVFHLNGISKLFALPDMKLGWVAVSGPHTEDYAGRLELLNDTYLSCSSLIQWMLPALFEKGMGFVEHMRRYIQQNLEKALGILRSCPALDLKGLPPDGGYYLFPGVREWRDEEALALYLLEEGGVLVHPGYFYGFEGQGAHIMLSCLTETAQLEEGLNRLVKALS